MISLILERYGEPLCIVSVGTAEAAIIGGSRPSRPGMAHDLPTDRLWILLFHLLLFLLR